MKSVLVTGGTGFIASSIIKLLLEKGYFVKTTVRNKKKVEETFDFDVSKVEFFEADLLKEGSFDEAVSGCTFVLHTAMSTVTEVKDPKKDMLDPALNGTKNVLSSCIKSKNLKRLVMTSSVATISQRINGNICTERDWNTVATLEGEPYGYAKTQAEKWAWQYMKDNAEKLTFDMVTIHPAMVIGKAHNKRLASSQLSIVKMMNGEMPVIPDLGFSFVHVDDVALAHVLAMENSNAHGRFIVSNDDYCTLSRVQKILLEKYGSISSGYEIPTWDFTGWFGTAFLYLYSYTQPTLVRNVIQNHLGCHETFDVSRMKNELGLTKPKMDTNEAIIETAEYCIKMGFLKSKNNKQ